MNSAHIRGHASHRVGSTQTNRTNDGRKRCVVAAGRDTSCQRSTFHRVSQNCARDDTVYRRHTSRKAIDQEMPHQKDVYQGGDVEAYREPAYRTSIPRRASVRLIPLQNCVFPGGASAAYHERVYRTSTLHTASHIPSGHPGNLSGEQSLQLCCGGELG